MLKYTEEEICEFKKIFAEDKIKRLNREESIAFLGVRVKKLEIRYKEVLKKQVDTEPHWYREYSDNNAEIIKVSGEISALKYASMVLNE